MEGVDTDGKFDPSSECIAIFDANDHLVSFNDNYRNLVPVSVHYLLTVGTSLEELVRESAIQGQYEIPDGDIETFVAARMEDHRNLPSAKETRFSNGRWVRRSEHRTHDGGSILMLIDVTDRVTAELEAAEAQATLHDAVESMSDGFVLFDADDRLVRYNTAYENMVNAVAPGSLVIGATFEELLRVWTDVGAYDLTDTERNTFIKDRLAAHRNTPSQHQHQHADGRWILVAEYPTNGGGTVLIQHDVSEIKEAELRALSLQNQVLEVLESLSEAFALFDADDRLVLFNDEYLKLNSLIADIIVPGLLFEDLIRTQIKRGLHPGAKGRVEDYVAERVAIHRNPPPSLEQELEEGLWLKITEFKTPSGAIAGLRSDITEQKRAEQALQESEARFRLLIEEAIHGIVIHRGLDIVFANAAAARILGYAEPADILNLGSVHDIIWPDEIERMEGYRQLRNRGEAAPSHYEFKGRKQDGSQVWLENRTRVVKWEGASVIQMTLADISERKWVEDELKASESKFSGILAIAPEAIISTDEGGIIRIFNQGAGRTFGYGEKEVLGKSVTMLMPEKFRTGHGAQMAGFGASDVRRRRMSERGEIVGRRKDGSEFPAEATISKLELGEETIFNVILRDITQQRRAEREVMEAKEIAESANRAKSEFLGNMSHELRTPLNAVNGFAQMLMNQTFGELGDSRYLEYAGHIHESGEHLLDVINDILDLSRIEAGKISLQDETFNINEVLASCILFLDSRISNKRLRITTPPDQAWPQLRADKRVVRQMLLNLLSNAVKFSHPDTRIDVAGQIEDDGGLTIIITDTGIGLTDKEIIIAMEPFGQVENSLSAINEGTGLGLPLVKSLIELHGGACEIGSAKSVGTQVSLLFPAERVVPRN